MRWSKRHSESAVELLKRLDRCLKGEEAHGDGELVEEPSLPKDHRECWPPLVKEANFSFPLDVLLIRAVWSKQPDPEVRKPDLDGGSPMPQVKLSRC